MTRQQKVCTINTNPKSGGTADSEYTAQQLTLQDTYSGVRTSPSHARSALACGLMRPCRSCYVFSALVSILVLRQMGGNSAAFRSPCCVGRDSSKHGCLPWGGGIIRHVQVYVHTQWLSFVHLGCHVLDDIPWLHQLDEHHKLHEL